MYTIIKLWIHIIMVCEVVEVLADNHYLTTNTIEESTMIKSILAKSSFVALLAAIGGTPALAVPLVNSLEVSSESVSSEKVSRDANGVNVYSEEFKVAQTSEDQVIADYLGTTTYIPNTTRNYRKTGDFRKAVNDVRRYFAQRLGVPLRRSADGNVAYVRLRDGTTVAARNKSNSFGSVPTVEIRRPGIPGSTKIRYF